MSESQVPKCSEELYKVLDSHDLTLAQKIAIMELMKIDLVMTCGAVKIGGVPITKEDQKPLEPLPELPIKTEEIKYSLSIGLFKSIKNFVWFIILPLVCIMLNYAVDFMPASMAIYVAPILSFIGIWLKNYLETNGVIRKL